MRIHTIRLANAKKPLSLWERGWGEGNNPLTA